MQPDRMAVLEMLAQADQELLLATQSVLKVEGELRPSGDRFLTLTEHVDQVRHSVEEARRALRSLAGQVRAQVPSADRAA